VLLIYYHRRSFALLWFDRRCRDKQSDLALHSRSREGGDLGSVLFAISFGFTFKDCEQSGRGILTVTAYLGPPTSDLLLGVADPIYRRGTRRWRRRIRAAAGLDGTYRSDQDPHLVLARSRALPKWGAGETGHLHLHPEFGGLREKRFSISNAEWSKRRVYEYLPSPRETFPSTSVCL
jgi:hypothetical protein